MIDKIKQWSGVVALVAILLVLIFGNSPVKFGSILDTSYFDYFQATTAGGFQIGSNTVINGSRIASFLGLTVGSSGTAFTRINGGTCYIQPYATTIAASTTATVECQGTAAVQNPNTVHTSALAGVTAGDNVLVNFATSTSGTNTVNGLAITAASASSTAGYIDLFVSNLTGGTYTWPTTGTATGTATYLVTH